MKKILLVFPGLSVMKDEGAKHRLNSFIDAYTTAGFKVSVLAFCKQGMFANKAKYLNIKAHWHLFPYILPLAKHPLLSIILEGYLQFVLAVFSYLGKYDLIQMEIMSVRLSYASQKARYITDIHGDSYHEYVETRNKAKSWFAEYLLKIQKHSLKSADHCIFVSDKLKKQLEKNTHSVVSSYSIISCGIDVERFASAIPPKTLQESLKGRIVLGYCGGFHAWQNVDKMIYLTKLLRDIDPRYFLLIYSNSSTAIYEKELKLLGAENYKHIAVNAKDIPQYLKCFHVGLIIRDNWILNQVSSPTKTGEYLASGLPVLATSYAGDIDKYASETELVYYLNLAIEKNDLKAIHQWITEKIKTSQDNLEQGKKVVEKYSFNEEFLKSIQQIANR